jgi:hypothetical protein
MYKSFENKLDKFFEQYDVPREPIASGMQAAISQKLLSIWDSGKYSKYNKVSNEEAERIITDKNKVVEGLNKAIKDVGNIANVVDTTKPEPGVSKKSKATANYIFSITGNKDPKVIKTILGEMLVAITTGQSPKQIKVTLNVLAKKHKLSEQQVNGILKMLTDPDTEFNDIEVASSIIANSTGDKAADTIAQKG